MESIYLFSATSFGVSLEHKLKKKYGILVVFFERGAPLSLPQLNRLVEASFVRDESSASNADVPVIPSQLKVTHQILSHWEPFRDLKPRFAGSRRAEHLTLHSQQHIVVTVENSVLRTEMTGLESLEEDDPKRILFYKPMGWVGQIRSHRRDEVWSPSL